MQVLSLVLVLGKSFNYQIQRFTEALAMRKNLQKTCVL